MATVTPNYSWPVPTSTDLVKNGATAIEALGDAIDATVFGLPSGSFTKINTTTFTTVASQSFNSVFSSTYQNYRIIFNVVGSTATDLRLKMRVGGTDNSASYYWLITGFRDTGGGYQASTAGDTSAAINIISSQLRQQIVLDICRPFEAQETSITGKSVGQDGTSGIFLNPSAFHAVNTSYDGFSLIPAAGTITGTVRVYGYAN